ncbi:SatD family protein [Actinomyces oricola]|uniref:SatD family protein n=1 Tax=Actinomyces oricola TaxID=206043 RepID=UPI000FFEA159|nr:SatD family protein [Actinomyces oricola]
MIIYYAIIADIVGSRRLPDRAGSQEGILKTFAQAGQGLHLPHPAWATVGDEFQALAASLDDALTLTLRTHLLLPEGLELRFGIGAGDATDLRSPDTDLGPDRGSQTGPGIQDGSAWWAARAAIDTLGGPLARQREARTLYREAPRPGLSQQQADMELLVNSMLQLRDHVVGRMKARERRLAAGLALGYTQSRLARQEGISQSAVSQSLRRSGATALLRPLPTIDEVA